MSFTETQVRKLRSKLNPRHVRTREAEGQTLSYLEGWHVVAEANRIFGFDAWDRETVTSDCVWTKQINGRFCAAYVARVRITVRTDSGRVIREGCGVGESNATTPGQAHDFAAKAAETDATKRALSTFGNAFGLSLYGSAAATAAPNLNAGERRMNPGSAAPVNSPEARHPAPPLESPDPRPEVTSSEPDVFSLDRILPHSRGRVDKSMLAISEPRRVRDASHRQFVASHPCMVCGRTPVEAHHLRFAQPRAMGRKVSDQFTVPLCALHHRDLHAHGNELSWWSDKKLNPIDMAVELWTGNPNRVGHAGSYARQTPASDAGQPKDQSQHINGATTGPQNGADDVHL